MYDQSNVRYISSFLICTYEVPNMSGTQTVPEPVWVVKTKVPLSWKEKLRKKMHERGYYTYDEFLRDLIREVVEDE